MPRSLNRLEVSVSIWEGNVGSRRLANSSVIVVVPATKRKSSDVVVLNINYTTTVISQPAHLRLNTIKPLADNVPICRHCTFSTRDELYVI